MNIAEGYDVMQKNIKEMMELSGAIHDKGPDEVQQYMAQLRKYLLSAQQTLNNFSERLDIAIGVIKIGDITNSYGTSSTEEKF